MSVAVFSLVHVSSNKDNNVSSLDSLSFFSFSSSVLILLTMSLRSSRMDSSVSSLDFFSLYIVSTSLALSSLIFLIIVLSISSLSFDSFLISS
jgi:hypothetical protein